MKDERGAYRERTWAPAWVWVAISGACLLATGSSLHATFGRAAAGGAEEEAALSALGPALGGGVLLLFATVISLFACLCVEVRSSHLFVSFGPVRLVHRRIRYDDIEAVRPVVYRPIREFGGWGIRRRGRTTAWTIRGNRAVAVTLRSGRKVYVGSRFPQRLAERIEAAMRGADGKGRAGPNRSESD
ncbi:MAG: hypothetical protein OXU64_00955 [Gemmatimonadota bacterium]|nr:hypothetical protein [Gemmatimonadota bacterium]